MSRAGRTTKIALGGVISVAVIAAFAWLPPFLGLGVAVASAACWCYWLERHELTASASGAPAVKSAHV